MSRYRISRRHSNAKFRAGRGTYGYNVLVRVPRGGIRL